MNRKILLLLAFFGVLATQVGAQTPNMFKQGGTVSVGPFMANYSLYRAQYLYPASQFTNIQGGTIQRIYFRPSATGSQTYTGMTIRLGMTSQTDFGTTNPGSHITTVSTVYSGSLTVNYTTGNWAEIVLQTPFNYNGTSTLILDFDYASSTTNSGTAMNCFMTGASNPYYHIYSYNGGGTNLYPYQMDFGVLISSGTPTKPVPLFFVPPSICAGSPVKLINTSVVGGYNISHQWTITPSTYTFQAGSSASSTSPTIIFAASGTYAVKLKVTNNIGVDSITQNVTITAPSSAPVAEFFTPVRLIPKLNPPILFTDLSTDCPQSWRWYSPDHPYNPFLDSTAQRGQAFFPFSGTFTICLEVTNAIGTSTVCKSAYIQVQDAVQYCTDTISTSATGFVTDEGGPGGNYANNRSLCTVPACPLNSCKGMVIDPCASSVTLTFSQIKLASGPGDSVIVHNGTNTNSPRILAIGSGANGTTPSVTATSGKMFVYMIANASGADSGFVARWTSVNGTYTRPTAGFTMGQQKGLGQDTVYSGYPIKYNNTTVGVDAKYVWDVNGDNFFDSVTANPSTILYNFTLAPERYFIKLLAYNCKGIDTIIKVVTILPVTSKPTQLDFVADKVSVSAQDTINFTDLSFGATQWNWNFIPASNVRFVGGTNKTTQNPKIMLSGAGCVRVTMTVKNSIGEDSLIKVCYVRIRNYCQPSTAVAPVSDIGINKVTFAGISNTSTSGANQYTNYYDSTNAAGNSFRTLSYTLTIDRNTNSNNVNWKAWIDFNLDGDFDDAGEEVLTKLNQSGTNVSQAVTIPVTAAIGSTILRVGVSAAASYLTPCAAQIGEFEDYKLNIVRDDVKPIITMLGSDTILIEQFATYADPGATAVDNLQGNLTPFIITSSTVNTLVTGYYNVCYDVSDAYGNAAVTRCRVVGVVVDRTPPVITLNGKSPDTVAVFGNYSDPGASAFDNYSGDLTPQIVVINTVNKDVVGTYSITYTVNDYFGLVATKTRTVYVLDQIKPVITRATSTTNHIHLVKMPLVDKNVVNVNDNYWQNVNPVRTGSVDINTLGTYAVCYNATDGSGNTATQQCFSIEVKDTLAPEITFVGNDSLTFDVFTTYLEPVPAVADNFYTGTDITFTSSGAFDRNKVGYYTITYTATDKSNNTSIRKRVIHIVDRVKPVITLKNNNIIVWPIGKTPYVDMGIQLFDNYYPESSLESLVKITSTVNPLVPDVYTYRYDLTDPSGNIADPAIRTVIVGVTGVNDVNLTSSVMVYPNPAKDQVNVYLGNMNKISRVSGDKITIRLMDMLGNVLVTKQADGSSDLLPIDVADYASGMYLIMIESGDLKASRKVNIIR